jgi:hypothetical protein
VSVCLSISPLNSAKGVNGDLSKSLLNAILQKVGLLAVCLAILEFTYR